MQQQSGQISKANVSLYEFSSGNTEPENHFIQIGIAGIFASKEELKNLYTILNYYLNIDSFSECTIKVGENYVTLS